jgi:hypothetical protein
MLVGCLTLALPGPVSAADGDARAAVEKAVKAVGGLDRLARFPAMTWKGKGKFYGLGEEVEFSAESAAAMADRMRSDINFEVKAMKIQYVMAVNGDKGWSKADGAVVDMDAETLAEEKANLYASWVARVWPLLKDPAFQLTPLGESKVGDRAVVGVKVSRKDRRDVSLFFDKDTGLLLKCEVRARDVGGGGNEFAQETLYGDYQETDGVKWPRKVTINRDGRRFVEIEVQERKLLEKLDDKVFAKP